MCLGKPFHTAFRRTHCLKNARGQTLLVKRFIVHHDQFASDGFNDSLLKILKRGGLGHHCFCNLMDHESTG